MPSLPVATITEMTDRGHGDRLVYDTERARFGAGRFGMILFLGSVAMLFIATILAVLAIRLDDNAWPLELPPMPIAVWVSTGLLLISSLTLQWGVAASRHDSVGTVRIMMLLTLALGIGFLISQTIGWFDWNAAIQAMIDRDEAAGLAATGFHVLTGIHALHVLGGLIPLTVITFVVLLGAWETGRERGIRYMAMYWHFLGIIWLALVVTLLLVL